MMDISELMEIRATTQTSLERIQEFDVHQLPRVEVLGQAFSFEAAVEPASKLVELFRKLPIQALEEFPDAQLKIIENQSSQIYQLFQSALEFDTKQPNPTEARDNIVEQIKAQYAPVFKQIYPLISFAVARTVDFSQIESQGRAAIQKVEDQTESLMQGINESRSQIETTLEEVRSAAAEQGVSQKAIYFKQEADNHDTQSNTWLGWTLVSAGLLATYSVGSLFVHNIPGLAVDDTYKAFQLAASKLLIFAVIGYIVLMCGRNFLSHKHNAIVNRHRQNALQTFTTLVEATSTPEAQDVVLTHAASSVFAPQETGYSKNQSQDHSISAASVVRALTQPSSN